MLSVDPKTARILGRSLGRQEESLSTAQLILAASLTEATASELTGSSRAPQRGAGRSRDSPLLSQGHPALAWGTLVGAALIGFLFVFSVLSTKSHELGFGK